MESTARFAFVKWLFLLSCFSSTVAVAEATPGSTESHFRMQRSADIDQVLVNAEGEAFALVLGEGSVVMLSAEASHLGFAAGQRVQVEGDAVETALNVVYYRARITSGGRLLQSANDAAARAPSHADCTGGEVTARGKLQAFLATPDGRINGLVFADGTFALATPEVRLNGAELSRGMLVEVSGPTLNAENATALRIDRLAFPETALRSARKASAER
jgi:hypothetical protein